MQKVVIVNGSADAMTLIEPVLDAGHYDMIFVESSAHAYSQIKRVRPDLIILFLDLAEEDSFRVLSMLRLDTATRDIPLLTSMVSPVHAEAADDDNDTSVTSLFGDPIGACMN